MSRGLRSIYQPIVEIRTGKVFGYEALVRGTQRQRLPATLFRKAYHRGSLADFDLACIGSALQILPRLGPKQLLFVNVEPPTLGSVFAPQAGAGFLLKKFSSYAHRIVFELTEGMKGRDFNRIKEGVRFLRRHGARFALDDVAGVGYKLIRLLSLKPDFVKIDLSLVQGLGKKRLQQDIVRRIVRLARKSRSVLVAEGLERRRDLVFVSRMGIRYVQGYYFGRPRKYLVSPTEQKRLVQRSLRRFS